MIKAIGLFLLMLLKIFGWIVLVLFLVLLAVLLLVSFVPVRYDVRVHNERLAEPGEKNPVKNIRVQVTVSWLAHFIHIAVSYGPEGMANKIRAAGIDVQKTLAWLSGRRQMRQNRRNERRQKKKRKSDSRNQNDSENTDTGSGEGNVFPKEADAVNLKQEAAEETGGMIHAREEASSAVRLEKSAGESIQTEQMEIKEESVKIEQEDDFSERILKGNEEKPLSDEQFLQDGNSESLSQSGSKEKQKSEEKEKPSGKRLKQEKQIKKELKKNIRKKEKKKEKKASFKNSRKQKEKKAPFSAKTGGIRDKIRQVYKEYKNETNRHAAGRLWKELCYLLRHYKPRKFEADVTFSLSDPALTGKVLGVISLMPSVYRYPCSIIPDFESDRLYLEGRLAVQGKVTVRVFLVSLLRLIRDREFRKAVKRLLKRG